MKNKTLFSGGNYDDIISTLTCNESTTGQCFVVYFKPYTLVKLIHRLNMKFLLYCGHTLSKKCVSALS